MNRKSVVAIFLVVSLIANIVLFVFAYVQKSAADHARQESHLLTDELNSVHRQTKAQLDECEGLRAQSDEARDACEQKLLAISNRQ